MGSPLSANLREEAPLLTPGSLQSDGRGPSYLQRVPKLMGNTLPSPQGDLMQGRSDPFRESVKYEKPLFPRGWERVNLEIVWTNGKREGCLGQLSGGGAARSWSDEAL